MFRSNQFLSLSRLRGWSVLLLISMLLVSACQPAATPTEIPTAIPTQPPAPTVAKPAPTQAPTEIVEAIDLAPQLKDKLWMLVGYGDAANPTVVEEGTVVTALFGADGNLSGSGGCNNFFTSYELDGDALTVDGPVASTMMACERGMNQESVVLAALEGAQQIAFTAEGRLEISYDSGSSVEQKLVYTPGETPLVDTQWVLLSSGDPANPTNVESGTIISALFTEDGRVSGSSGCNNFSAGYSVKDGAIEIKQPISTLMACTQGMEQEAAFTTALLTAETYQIIGSRLEIGYDGGKGMLVFTSRNLTLENTLWTLAMMNGERVNLGLTATTALFDPGAEPGSGVMGGVAMCNNYRGGYSVEEDVLSIEPLATTLILCPEAVAQAETTYLELLETAQTYQVLGQTLIITSEKGALIYVANRAPLEGTLWRLTALGAVNNPQAPVEGADFTAQFMRQAGLPSGLVAGTTGCNDYNAVYAANLNEIKINLPARSDNSGCVPGLSEQELVFFLALHDAVSFRILGDNLQIPYGDGQMLSFTAFVPELEPQTGGPLTPLNGTRWWLISLGNQAVIPGSEVTTEFAINPDGATGAVSGSSGCNTYNAPILNALQIGPAATTKKLCAEPAGVMEQEARYLAMLASANSFSMASNQLVIGSPNGMLVYYNSPAPVIPIQPTPGVTPELPATVTPELPAEPTAQPPVETEEVPEPPTAVITAPVEGVSGEKINFDASATISEAGIKSYKWDFGDGNFSVTVDRIRGGRRSCEQEIMLQESSYLSALEKVMTASIQENMLRLTYPEGTLIFYLISPP